MTGKISIIIPAYNAGGLIERTLNSICNQTYTNLEIIIVDDGSIDDTFEKCMEFSAKDNRFNVYHQENQGVTKARELGISKATGDYIAFVDSDDTIEPQMYEVLYNNIKKYDADISHCGYKTINDSGKVEFFYNTGEVKVQSKNESVIDLIIGEKVGPSLWNKLYKKDLFNDLTYDTSMRINEDYAINLLVFLKSKLNVFEDKPYYNYYQNENSGSSKVTKEYFYRDILKAADLTDLMCKDDEELYPYAQRRWFRTYSSTYKNQVIYKCEDMEFDKKKLLVEVMDKLKKAYPSVKKNKLLTSSDKFILYTLRYCPKLLIFICKLR